MRDPPFLGQGVLIWEMLNTMLEGESRPAALKLFCPGQNYQFSTIYGNAIIGKVQSRHVYKKHHPHSQAPVEAPTW